MQKTIGNLPVEAVDADGAVREAADAVAGDTRAALFAKAGLIGGGALAGAALLPGVAQAQSRGDVAILNFALTLEYLEAAFYARAVRGGALDGELELFARVAGAHETAHVRAIKGILGARAVRKPRFDFGETTEDAAAFTETAIALEETGTAAYKGQAPLIRSEGILAAALTIHSVEARHTAWIRDIAGLNPAPVALDPPATREQVLATVANTGFIAGPPRRRRRRPRSRVLPRFTG